MDSPCVFAGNPLDRADDRRREADWIAVRLSDPDSRFLPLWRLSVLVREESSPRLAWARNDLIDSMNPETGPVFLGLRDDVAHFALDLSELSEPEESLGVAGTAKFSELRAIAGQLAPGDAGIAAQARHLIDWHARHRYCPACGSKTGAKDAGHARLCTNSGCAREHFPRTDPVVIMLAIREGHCLLGRQGSWPSPFFSALAGFVEPGETLEEAVRREVHEEAGIEIGAVHYQASQPWRFPASLMLGCRAEATSVAIHVDGAELEDARWFSRAQVQEALEGPTAELAVPPPLAIAHQLIGAWAREG